MILIRDVESGELVSPDGSYRLRTHKPNEMCFYTGCVIHNPDQGSIQNIESWPYNWRTDNGVMERLCIHGIGHPDIDAVRFADSLGHTWVGVHGCDGCCSGDEVYESMQGEKRETYGKDHRYPRGARVGQEHLG